MRNLGIVAGGVCILLAGFASQFTVSAAPAPKGPSVGDVYVLNSGVGTNQPLCDQASCSVTVASMIVPAGSYTIAAKVVFNRWMSQTPAQSYCYLYAAGSTTPIDVAAAATSLDIELATGSLQGARTFSAPETLSIRCADSIPDPGGQHTAAQNWQLMATRVGTINSF